MVMSLTVVRFRFYPTFCRLLLLLNIHTFADLAKKSYELLNMNAIISSSGLSDTERRKKFQLSCDVKQQQK